MLKRLLFSLVLLWAFAAQATVYSLPWGPKPQFVDANGAPMSSATLQTFAAGSSTPQVTYTDSTGGVANPTTITLNTRGESPNEVWLTGGQTYKFVLKDSSGVTVWTVDNVSGVNDIAISNAPSEWISGPTPTYVSATQFTLAGDQTVTFTVGRRLKSTNSGGTVYSYITASVFGAVTTVTIVNDASTLDSGLSAVSYGMLASTNQSSPPAADNYPQFENNTDKTKRAVVSLSGITTATIRTVTLPDKSGTMAMTSDVDIQGSIVGGARNLRASQTAAGASITYTADEITVETALGGTSQKLASYSQTLNSGTTGAGGLDTGVLPTSGFLAVYAIAKADGTKSILGCNVSVSTASIYAGANMPSGYTYSALIGIWPTNGTPNLIIGFQLDRAIRFVEQNIFTATTGQAAFTTQSLSAAVPAAAKWATGIFGGASAGVRTGAVASDANGIYYQRGGAGGTAVAMDTYTDAFAWRLPMITANTIFWKTSENTATVFRLGVTGYEF